MSVRRRTVLKAGFAGAAALAVGGLGLGLQGTALRAPSRPLRALNEAEYSVLAAIADRVCPGGGGFPSAASLGVAESVDELLATLDPATAGEIRLLLRLLENALPGLLLDGRSRPFTACTPAQQDEALRAWQLSTLSVRRSGYKVLRSLCASAYYADPRVFAACGYGGPPDSVGAGEAG